MATTSTSPITAKTDENSETAARSYLTLDELAAHTGLSPSTLRRLWRRRRIVGYQPGGPGTRVLFPPDAIERAVGGESSSTDPLPSPLPPDPQRGPRPRWQGGPG